LETELPIPSRKVYVESEGVAVPVREISLGGGEAPIRVYDTTGPQGLTYTRACPSCARRGSPAEADVETSNFSQMHCARAARSPRRCASWPYARGMRPEFVRDEIAAGRAILPANIRHPSSNR
jgi:phosphomethylpyrimidine synthase